MKSDQVLFAKLYDSCNNKIPNVAFTRRKFVLMTSCQRVLRYLATSLCMLLSAEKWLIVDVRKEREHLSSSQHTETFEFR